jgi:hypothetical protein
MSQAPTPPEHPHPIDPVSQALGRVEGRLEGLEKRVDDRLEHLVGGLREVRTELRDVRGEVHGLAEHLPSRLELRTLAGVVVTIIVAVGGLVLAALARLPR